MVCFTARRRGTGPLTTTLHAIALTNRIVLFLIPTAIPRIAPVLKVKDHLAESLPLSTRSRPLLPLVAPSSPYPSLCFELFHLDLSTHTAHLTRRTYSRFSLARRADPHRPSC